MELKLEELHYFDFCTSSATGAAADADSTPTAEVFEDGGSSTVVALTVTKRTGKTGNYYVPVTAAAADGFEVGKSYNVIGYATMGGIATKARIGNFKVRLRGKDDLSVYAGGAVASVTAAVSVTGDLSSTMKASVTAAVPTVAQIAAQVTSDHGDGSYIRNTEPDSATDIAAAVLSAAEATPIASDAWKMNGTNILGTGVEGDLWRGEPE